MVGKRLVVSVAVVAAVVVVFFVLFDIRRRLTARINGTPTAWYELWFGGKHDGVFHPLDERFAKELDGRKGAKTSAGMTVLTDPQWSKKEIGRVVFRVRDAVYAYPFYEAVDAKTGESLYVWWGPQNDLRIQTPNREQFLVALGGCLQAKGAPQPRNGCGHLPPERWTPYKAP